MDSIAPIRNPHLFTIVDNGNSGIVPPWLAKPPVIGLPVEPDDEITLPVLPPSDVIVLPVLPS